jgi:hypothetical protein
MRGSPRDKVFRSGSPILCTKIRILLMVGRLTAGDVLLMSRSVGVVSMGGSPLCSDLFNTPSNSKPGSGKRRL